jgi:hypothetical protein
MNKLEFTWGRGSVLYILPTLGWQRIRMGRSATWVLWCGWLWWYAEVGN